MIINAESLKDVRTEYPVLEPGLYPARIVTVTQEPNSKNTGNNLILELLFLDATLPLHHGGEIPNQGLKLKFYVSLAPTEKYDPRVNLARLYDAIGLDRDAQLTTEDLQNVCVVAKVKYNPARDDAATGKSYSESNSVDMLIHVGEDFVEPAM